MSDLMYSADTDDVSKLSLAGVRKPSAQWLAEIEKATKDYREYHARCDKIRSIYRYQSSRAVKTRKFALLWSNTETLKSAVYAKPPVGVVQSRFRDGDPVVRTASTLLERAINFNLDLSDYDHIFALVRDDFLLYGRGVPRLVYRPVFEEVPDGDDALAGKPDDTVEGEYQHEVNEVTTESSPYGGERGQEDGGVDEVSPVSSPYSEEPEQEPGEVLKFEHIDLVYVDREDYIHPKARRYEELPWIAYRSFLARDELVEKFGEIGRQVPLDATSIGDKTNTNNADSESAQQKATVYEIWCKTTGMVCWVAPGCPYILDECPPYLKLTGFFPSPRPAYGTMTSDTLEPIPEYTHYQDQAEEINTLTARIASLMDSLKLVGFYPAGPQGEGAPEIELAVRPGVENKLIAVKSWAAFKEGGQGSAPIVWLPVQQVGEIIKGCVQLRKQLIDDVYQITGISDIQRGATDPNETYGAQSLKAQFGSVRIRERQGEIARLCRDVVRMMAEIISEHFHIETLMALANMRLPSQQEISELQNQAILQQGQWKLAAAAAQQNGQPIPPPPPPPQINGPTQEQIMMLLKDGVQRRFRIDIEADSTIAADQAREQQARTQFVGMTTQFIQAWGPIIQAQPALAPLAGALLMFGSRAFLVGRELEETIEETIQKIEQQSSQPKPPPQPSPDEQLRAQAEQARAAASIQAAQVKSQAEQAKAAADIQQTQADQSMAVERHQMDMQQAQMDLLLQRAKLEEAHLKAFQMPPVAYPDLAQATPSPQQAPAVLPRILARQ